MRKTILISLILALGLGHSLQAQCSFDGDYRALFKLQKIETPNGKELLLRQITEVDEEECYAKAVNSMPEFFSYLKTNFSYDSLYREIDLDQDSSAIRSDFYKALNQDAKLTAKLDEFALRSYGKLPKDTVLFEEIVDVAVKFFSLKGINDEGQYEGKICVGINGITETMEQRKAFIEAFAFAAILNDIKNQKPNLSNEFSKESKELYDLNLGINKEDRLLRAQGAVYMAMKNNNRLNAILASYYASHFQYLPFVIRGQ